MRNTCEVFPENQKEKTGYWIGLNLVASSLMPSIAFALKLFPEFTSQTIHQVYSTTIMLHIVFLSICLLLNLISITIFLWKQLWKKLFLFLFTELIVILSVLLTYIIDPGILIP